MATLPNSNNMMAGILTSGFGESGYGVRISGFLCPTREFPARLFELEITPDTTDLVTQWEELGNITFLACRNESNPQAGQPWKAATFRREPHKFFSDLSTFLKSLRAQFVGRMVLSGSNGSLQLTVLYRAAPGMPRENV